MRSLCFVAVTALLTFIGNVSAAAPEYPNKPIRYIVATGPGGASDLVGRTMRRCLSEMLGVQIVIDNRSGAGNTVGAEIAARAAPDGYTLLSCNIASLAVGPALYKKLGYDPERDFALARPDREQSQRFHRAIHRFRRRPSSNSIELAKANPGKLNYASAASGPRRSSRWSYSRCRPASTRPRPLQRRRAGTARSDGRPCRSHDFDGAVGAVSGAQRQDSGAGRDIEAARSAVAGRADHRRVGNAGLRGRLMAGFVHERRCPGTCLRGFAARSPRCSRSPRRRSGS